MEVISSFIYTFLAWLVDGANLLFSILFGWLPDDFLAGFISDLQTVAAANLQAIQWLNWFVDVPFFVMVFAYAVAALVAWTGFQIMMYLAKKAVEAFEAVTP